MSKTYQERGDCSCTACGAAVCSGSAAPVVLTSCSRHVDKPAASTPATELSLRVQVPNNHILSQIVTYITTIRIGVLGFGVKGLQGQEDLRER